MCKYKKGDCIFQETKERYQEGVIFEVKKRKYDIVYDVLMFTRFKYNNTYQFDINKEFTIANSYQITQLPHFYTIENFYNTLRTYSQNLKLMGVSSQKNKKNEYNIVTSAYLQVNNKLYIEIISPIYKRLQCNDCFIYVEESNCIFDTYFCFNKPEYYVPRYGNEVVFDKSTSQYCNTYSFKKKNAHIVYDFFENYELGKVNPETQKSGFKFAGDMFHKSKDWKEFLTDNNYVFEI